MINCVPLDHYSITPSSFYSTATGWNTRQTPTLTWRMLLSHHHNPPTRQHYQPQQDLLIQVDSCSSPNFIDSENIDRGQDMHPLNTSQPALTGSSQYNCSISTSAKETTPTTQVQCTSNSDIVALLQQQQAMLQEMMSHQEHMQQKQLEFDHKLLAHKPSKMTESSSASWS